MEELANARQRIEQQTQQLAQKETRIAGLEKVKITTAVDPALLGGLSVQIGDKYLDLSAATKIGSVSRAL